MPEARYKASRDGCAADVSPCVHCTADTSPRGLHSLPLLMHMDPTPHLPTPDTSRMRDKAYISERFRTGRRLAEASVTAPRGGSRTTGAAGTAGTAGTAAPAASSHELPWDDAELYCVYSLGQRFMFFIQVRILGNHADGMR